MSAHDPLRAAHGLLYARALGVRKAAAFTGITHTQLTRYRQRAGITERLPNPGKTGHGKLSLEKARAIREARRQGEKQEALAALYGVHRATISKIERGMIYPEPKS